MKDLKALLREKHKPQWPKGCRLLVKGKVMKSRHDLKHYGIKDGDNVDDIITMDDNKNWKSESSSSSSAH